MKLESSVIKSLKKFLLSFLLIQLLPVFLLSQPISSDTWVPRNLNTMHDLGLGWEVQSLFKPYRMESLINSNLYKENQSKNWLFRDTQEYVSKMRRLVDASENQITAATWIGFLGQIPYGNDKPFKEKAASLYLINRFWFKKHFCLEWYFRASSDSTTLEHFTAYPRQVRRLGMNSGEFDQATLSYNNSWITLQLGRGRQIWGPGLKENLVFSSESASYDHFLAEAKYKNWSAIYFTGFLESIYTDEHNFNRYIIGHGLQYNNKRNFLISVSEVTNYYGNDRSIDISYMNPFVAHSEIELNNRENDLGKNHSNGIWTITMDWLMLKQLRLSASYLIDDIQIDKKDREMGRIDATALQVRLAKSFVYKKSALTFFGKYVRVSTFTYRHRNQYTTFLSRNLTLGLPAGSDFYSYHGGLVYIAPIRLKFRLNYEHKVQGENNIIENKYVRYLDNRKREFPSGVLTRYHTAEINLLYSFKKNVDLEMTLHFQSKTIEEKEKTGNYYLMRFNYYFPVSFSL